MKTGNTEIILTKIPGRAFKLSIAAVVGVFAIALIQWGVSLPSEASPHSPETVVTPNTGTDTPEAAVLETLTDRCSTSVRIVPSLIYDSDSTGMVPGNQSPIRLKRPVNKNKYTAWTEKRTVGLTSTGRFPWYCGKNAHNSGGTKEQSRCPSGTNALSARLGPDRLLQIRCYSN